MDVRIDDKILLVTGGAQGSGRAVALEAARSGAAGIVLTDRNAERGAEAVAAIERLGVPALFVRAELADPDAPEQIVAAALGRFGRVDALANVAALSDRGSVAEAGPAFFDRLFAVNTRAPMFLMQGLIRHLQERKAPGAIVNILSMNAHGGSTELAVYSATKAALSLLTRNAAKAHRFDRIRVMGINLGWVDTPAEWTMQAATLGKGEAWLAQAEASMPWGRLLKPEDVARLTLFLLSDASLPMTGAVIDQDQENVLGVSDG